MGGVQGILGDSRGKDLYNASRCGDLASMQRILEEAPQDARTLLHYKQPGTGGKTALHIASQNAHSAVVAELLRAGADCHATMEEEALTPLHLACGSPSQGALPTVQTLLSAGADPNALTKPGDMPLVFAVLYQGAPLVAELLRAGALVNLPRPGPSLLHEAAAIAGNGDVIRALVNAGHPVDALAGLPDARTPLMEAAWLGRMDAAIALIECGANVNAHTKLGAGPLTIAACKGHAEMIQLFINAGADVHNIDGAHPAIIAAVQLDCADACRVLIRAGAKPDGLEKRGTLSALHWAAGFNCVDSLDTMITTMLECNKALNLDTMNCWGATPLSIACAQAKFRSVDMLLSAGARANAPNSACVSPLGEAIKSIVTCRSPDRYDIQCKMLHACEHLCRAGASVNAPWGAYSIDICRRYPCWSTPLHIAAQSKYVEVIEWLIRAGAHTDYLARQAVSHYCAGLELELKDGELDVAPHVMCGLLQPCGTGEGGADADIAHDPPLLVLESLWDVRSPLSENLWLFGIHGPQQLLSWLDAAAFRTAVETGSYSSSLLETQELRLARWLRVHLQAFSHAPSPASDERECPSVSADSVNKLTTGGASPLILAALSGSLNACERLLGLGASPTLANQYTGGLALHAAAARGDEKMTSLLLAAVSEAAELSSYVNHKDNRLWTALHYAAAFGHASVCQILVRAGADQLPALAVSNTSANSKFVAAPVALAAAAGHAAAALELLNLCSGDAQTLQTLVQAAFCCAIIGDHSVIATMLLERFSANTTIAATVGIPENSVSMPPLHLAARFGSLACAQALFRAGVGVNTEHGSQRRTALHHAACCGHEAVVKELLAARANVNCTDRQSLAPVQLAAAQGHSQVVNILLSAGAHVTPRRLHFFSIYPCVTAAPLFLAAHSGNRECVRVLLDAVAVAGAPNLATRDADGISAVEMACMSGNAATVTLLLERGASAVGSNASCTTPLHAACASGCLSACRALLNAGARVDINSKDSIDATPLSTAASAGFSDIAQLLLDNGADAEIHCRFGDYTAIDIAIQLHHVDVVAALLSSGPTAMLQYPTDIPPVSPESLNQNMELIISKPARYKAARHNNPRIVRMLLDAGQPATGSWYGTPALVDAAKLGADLGCTELLRDGASANVTDLLGVTPLVAALTVTREYLKRKDSASANTVGVGSKRRRLARILLAAGADVNASCARHGKEDPVTPLLLAVEAADVQLVKELLSRGADVTARGKHDQQPLHVAAEVANEAIIELLLDAGADITAKDAEGKTPLGRCEQAEREYSSKSEAGKEPIPDSREGLPEYGICINLLRIHGARKEI